MTAREAFLILVRGTHRRTGCWESERLKAKAFLTPTWDTDILSGIFRRRKSRVLAAKEYYQTPKSWVSDGSLTFPSVYDLALFLESQRYRFSPPESMAFRGQRDSRWVLLPSLAREPLSVQREIDRLVSWLSALLASRPCLATRSSLELIAIAQHYGHRTCLLDFTLDPLIAVAFACHGHVFDSCSEHGAVYYAFLSETQRLAPSTDLATGSVIRFGMEDIPRIQKQRGLFIGGFNPVALSNLLHVQRYLFCHSEDTHTFIQDAGLTDEELFPNAVLSVDNLPVDPRTIDSAAPVLAEVEAILRNWTTKCFRSMTWKEYYEIAESYARTHVKETSILSPAQKKRLRIFCRFFSDLQTLPLPEHALMMLQLERVVYLVCRFPDSTSECGCFVEQFASFKQSQESLPAVRDALRKARCAEAYRVSEDGPQVGSTEDPWLEDGV